MGQDAVSALPTVTKLGIGHPEEIIDEYVMRGFYHVFLRMVSPYGRAVNSPKNTQFPAEEFLDFYTRAVDYVISLNRQGVELAEGFAELFFRKILTPFPDGYVDMQSPAGAGIGCVVYYHDGRVFPSDEARMLAEMGNPEFCMGSVYQHSFEELYDSDAIRTLVPASCNEALPGCADCVFQNYCGADPIRNFATHRDVFGHRPTSDLCKRNKGVLTYLFGLLQDADRDHMRIFFSWIRRVSIRSTDIFLPDDGHCLSNPEISDK